ncbi:MAG: DUF5615 family PIN-like protein [Chitinophagaceae bacterium]|nr:DUF5615 family PIN-like protein [Chitinophagaceae bacterium]
MKVLLDENLPEELKADLHQHEVYSIREMNWKGKKNGELLQLLEQNGFGVFLTSDKNLRHQQNLKKYSIVVMLLDVKQNTYPAIKILVPNILRELKKKLAGGLIIIP